MKLAGWSFGQFEARLAALPAIAVVGCATWLMLPQTSDAEGHAATLSEVTRLTENASPDGGSAGVQATLADTAPMVAFPGSDPRTPVGIGSPAPVESSTSPLDGLKIVSQSWRRGGLGSKALVTFTLRNANKFAVKNVEIACSFARQDGRHLTDRRRMIPDTINMKSRKRYASMLVGFVNVNANKAKCSVVTASRL